MSTAHLTARSRVSRTIATAIAVLLAVYILVPIYWMVVASTKDNNSLLTTFGFWFAAPFDLISNINNLFTLNGGVYVRWYVNSIIYSIIGAGLATLLAAAAGYGLSCFKFRGRQAVLVVTLVSLMVPFTALAIPTFLIESRIALVDRAAGVVLPAMLSPIGMILVKVYADRAVPAEMLDAARVDGANEFLIWRKVAVPILWPPLVTALLLALVGTWNNYFLPLLVLSRDNLFTLPVGLAVLNSQAAAGAGHQFLDPLIIIGGLLAIIPLIVVFMVLQRYWRSGLTAGSVQG